MLGTRGKLGSIAAAVLVALAGAAWLATGAAATPESRSVPGACPKGDPLAPDELRADVSYLASGALGGRAPASAGDNAAMKMIAARFRCLGLEPAGERGGYFARFTTSEGDRTANVVGLLPGSDPKLADEPIVLGAHHDHLGSEGGQTFHGANDNASGVAGLLAVAAELSARDEPLRRPVIFASFGGEETIESAPFLEGSVRFVRKPPLGLKAGDIDFMVNLDMIGTYRNRGLAYVLGPQAGDPGFAQIHAANQGPDRVRLRYPGALDTEGMSDHWPFARSGIPTAFFWTPDVRCYHRPCDVPRRLDFEPMSRLVGVVAGSTERLAEKG